MDPERAQSIYRLPLNGKDRTWWAFYSAAVMANNLCFTLTPDSMTSFRDATWPILIMHELPSTRWPHLLLDLSGPQYLDHV